MLDAKYEFWIVVNSRTPHSKKNLGDQCARLWSVICGRWSIHIGYLDDSATLRSKARIIDIRKGLQLQTQ